MDHCFESFVPELAATKRRLGFGSDAADPYGLTDFERLAVWCYSCSSYFYSELNRKIRLGDSVSQNEYDLIELMDGALEKLPPHTGTVFRGHFEPVSPAEINDLYGAGQFIEWRSFTSSTLDGEAAFDGNILFFISSLSARPIMMYSESFYESEALFPRGCQFRSRGTMYRNDPRTGEPRHVVILDELDNG